LQLDVLLIGDYHFGTELDPNGDVVLRLKSLVSELEQYA
jgi:hypothetical protein